MVHFIIIGVGISLMVVSGLMLVFLQFRSEVQLAVNFCRAFVPGSVPANVMPDPSFRSEFGRISIAVGLLVTGLFMVALSISPSP